MRQSVTVLVLAAVLLAGFGEGISAELDTNVEETHRQKFSNYYDYLKAGEANVIAAAPERAKREGSELLLKVGQGTWQKFVTRSCEPASWDNKYCFSHYLMASLPSRHLYVLAKGYSEESDTILVDDRTGQELVVGGFPMFGDDAQRFIVLFKDDSDQAAHAAIYQLTSTIPQLEWSGHQLPIPFEFIGEFRMLQWKGDEILLKIGSNNAAEKAHIGKIVKANDTWQFTLMPGTP